MSEEQDVQETQEEKAQGPILSEASQIIDRSNRQILEWKEVYESNTHGLRSLSAHAVLNQESRNVDYATIIESVTRRRLESEKAIAADIEAFLMEKGLDRGRLEVEALVGAVLVRALQRPLNQFLHEQYGDQVTPSSGA